MKLYVLLLPAPLRIDKLRFRRHPKNGLAIWAPCTIEPSRMDKRNGHAALCCAGLLAVTIAQPAYAGPPYLTDDPEPTDLHHWEIYNFVAGERDADEFSLDAGEDINYGAAKDLQLTMVLPLHQETGQPLDVGNVELGVKWRFARQHPGTPSVDASFFPSVSVPTGRGASRAQLRLPIWLQRDFGPWSVFGGGGYTLNPGPGNRNFAQAGVAITRTMQPGFQLGVELYDQTSSAQDERAITGVNVGSTIHIKGPFSWLMSLGQGINRRQTVFYSALKLDL
jgi:hypothetical protein